MTSWTTLNPFFGTHDLLCVTFQIIASRVQSLMEKNYRTDIMNEDLVNSTFPEGYLVVGTILSETDPNGITEVQLILTSGNSEQDNSRCLQSKAYSTRVFSIKDIGKEVVCSRIFPSGAIMIMGLLYQPQQRPLNIEESSSLLDDILSQRANELADASLEKTSTKCKDKPISSLEDFTVDTHESDDTYEEVLVYDEHTDLKYSDKGYVCTENTDHIFINANKKITLAAGNTSITLHADGRIKFNGKYIHSKASHIQRITGGAVKIN